MNHESTDPEHRILEVHDPTAGAHSRPLRRSDDAHAFVPDPYETGPAPAEFIEEDEATVFAEELGQEYVAAVTGNVDMGEQELELVTEMELGGPFTVTTMREEVADDEDENNPPGATREPFPTAMRGGVEPSTGPRR
ncbi:MAG: hypothetical protein HOW73_08655 [Polyangiaceae bacterium]|nr:hypothetical protein [Polyangiaceae bacterium]